MAFVRKTGSMFEVRKGDNNQLLSKFASAAEAAEEVKKLHDKNKPTEENKGQSAKSDFFDGNAPKKEKSTKKKKSKKTGTSIARPSAFSDERFRVENAADTMMRFQEINADSKLKAKAKKELARRQKAISKARKV